MNHDIGNVRYNPTFSENLKVVAEILVKGECENN